MWYIILGLLSLIYLLINLVLPSVLGGFFGAYVVRPLLWALLALTVFLIAKKDELNIYKFKKIRRWEIGKDPFQAALLIGGFQVSLLVIAGLFFGFGESPYAFTPFAILTNIFFVISALVGIELARAYLVKKWASTRRNITLVIGLMALIFMIIAIPPSDFTVLNFSNPAVAVKFIGETIIPLFAMSLFASYLAYLGGALAAIGYMGVLQAFQWFSPVLPDLDWAVAALIGTLAPAIGFVIIQNSIQLMQKTPSSGRKRHKKKDPALGWTAVATICVLLIFFSTGFLGVQPTIIYSGSMRDSIDVGDIVIVSEVPIDEIYKGDIIQFKNENMSIPVIHRVYEIHDNEGNKVFVTKGDANDDPDREPVMPGQIMGKAIFNIPKVGWISIAIKTIVNKFGFSI